MTLSPAALPSTVRLVLSTLLLALTVYDLRHKRVPNAIMHPALLIAWAVLGVRAVLGQVGWGEAGIALGTGVVCLGLWWLRAFGGGDMKLVMALVALFPDARLVYLMLATVLVGLLVTLAVWDGRAGLRRLAALLATASQGALPGRAEIASAYQSRGRPLTFAFSLGALLYIWLIWPGWW